MDAALPALEGAGTGGGGDVGRLVRLRRGQETIAADPLTARVVQRPGQGDDLDDLLLAERQAGAQLRLVGQGWLGRQRMRNVQQRARGRHRHRV